MAMRALSVAVVGSLIQSGAQAASYFLAPKGHNSCPSGSTTVATESECRMAAVEARDKAGRSGPNGLWGGSWWWAPKGCSINTDHRPHFNTRNGKQGHDGIYNPVCRSGTDPAPAAPADAPQLLWANASSPLALQARSQRQVFQQSGLTYQQYSGTFRDGFSTGTVGTLPMTNPSRATSINFNPRPNYCGYLVIGYFRAPTTGNYRFRFECDDGCAMWMGDLATAASGRTRVNNLVHASGGYAKLRSDAIPLVGGTEYPVRMTYYEWNGAAFMRFWWSGPGISETRSLSPHFYTIGDGADFAAPTTTQTTTTTTTTSITTTTLTTTTATSTTTTATTTTSTATSTTTTTVGVFECEDQWPTEPWVERWDTYCAGSTGEAAWAMTKDCTVAWPSGADAAALIECRELAAECVIFDTGRAKCGRARPSTTTTTTTTTTGTNTTTTATTNATTAPVTEPAGLNTTQLFLSLDVDSSGRVTYLDLST